MWRIELDEVILLGVKLNDEVQVMQLLVTLPSTWRPFITTQLMITSQTLNQLLSKIQQEKTMRTHQESISHPSAIATTTNRQTKNHFKPIITTRLITKNHIQNNYKPHTKKCNYCHLLGHTENECSKKQYHQWHGGKTHLKNTLHYNYSTLRWAPITTPSTTTGLLTSELPTTRRLIN